MKRIVLITLLGGLATCSFAQLKVAKDGSTTVTSSSMEVPYALCGENNNIGVKGVRSSYGSDWGYGVYGESGNYYTEHSVGVAGIATSRSGNAYQSGHAYGVWGEASLAGTGYNYGVFGRLGGSESVWGAAVYGTVSATDNGQQIGGRYAGYFAGNVCMTGDLSVEGNVLGSVIVADRLYVSSISQSASASMLSAGEAETVSDKVAGLSAVTEYAPTKALATAETGTAGSLRAQQAGRLHYGLSAEQVEEAFPDLVYTAEDGTKLINYTELIPILIQSIAELKAEVAALGGGNGSSAGRKLAFSATGLDGAIGEETLNLCQNNPNPFNTSTTIAMYIPQGVQHASLYIYDMNGKQIRKTDITGRGQCQMVLSASELEAGMYLYTLVADGDIVATKRMILTK